MWPVDTDALLEEHYDPDVAEDGDANFAGAPPRRQAWGARHAPAHRQPPAHMRAGLPAGAIHLRPLSTRGTPGPSIPHLKPLGTKPPVVPAAATGLGALAGLGALGALGPSFGPPPATSPSSSGTPSAAPSSDGSSGGGGGDSGSGGGGDSGGAQAAPASNDDSGSYDDGMPDTTSDGSSDDGSSDDGSSPDDGQYDDSTAVTTAPGPVGGRPQNWMPMGPGLPPPTATASTTSATPDASAPPPAKHTTAIGAGAGAAAGFLVGGPIGAGIGAIVGAAIGWVKDHGTPKFGAEGPESVPLPFSPRSLLFKTICGRSMRAPGGLNLPSSVAIKGVNYVVRPVTGPATLHDPSVWWCQYRGADGSKRRAAFRVYGPPRRAR